MLKFKDFFENKITLQYHEELNPKLWKNNALDPEVRKHLLTIAESWREFANIPKNAIKDVMLTGGNANFNYTKHSDIDVHLIVDLKKIDNCKLLDDYLLDKKTLWAVNHNIKVFGYPVELYAQDEKEKTPSNQGAFSLKNNKWIIEPKKVSVNLNDPYLLKKINQYEEIIDQFMSSKSDNLIKMKEFKDKLKSMRQSAIHKGGEFSLENLVFKDLRNRGIIDKFSDYIKNIEDHKLSI
jgi:hypothetical protein